MKPIVFALVHKSVAADTVLPDMVNYSWRRFDTTDGPEAFVAAYHRERPVGFFSIGGKAQDFDILLHCPHALIRLWIHLHSIADFQENLVPNNYIHAVHRHRYADANPLISVFTTTFHSGDKIVRALHSLQAQTYTNWEWVIWDDSKDQETYKQLQGLADQDVRIRVYKDRLHSGFIGHVKRLAASCCIGDWLVEMDHDDELVPEMLSWLVAATKEHPEADFVYSDATEVYEDTGLSHSYGDRSAFGFGAHVYAWLRNKWLAQYVSPELNVKTLQHIVGVPNHVRIWKRTFYHAIGGHNCLLPVADDYDLLLRTALHGRWLHVPAIGYIQYRNRGSNNFTFKRNALIQHLVLWLADRYKPQILESFGPGSPRTEMCWHDETRQWPVRTTTWLPKPYDYETTISIVMPTYNRAEDLRRAIESVAAQTDRNWILFIVGDKCPTLVQTMESLAKDWSSDKSGDKSELLRHRIRFWNLQDPQRRLGTLARNYALRMLVKTKWVTYLDDDNTWAPEHLASLRPGMVEPNAFVLASLMVQGLPIVCDRAVLGRVDSSALCHRHDLVDKYNYWPVKNVEYANEIQFARPWLGLPFYATKQPTVNYNTRYNSQTYESILALATDAKPGLPTESPEPESPCT